MTRTNRKEKRTHMATMWKPDQTFYPSPRMAMSAPREKLAYVVVLNPQTNGSRRPDALAVMNVDPDSSTYLDVVGRLLGTLPSLAAFLSPRIGTPNRYP